MRRQKLKSLLKLNNALRFLEVPILIKNERFQKDKFTCGSRSFLSFYSICVEFKYASSSDDIKNFHETLVESWFCKNK